MVRSFQIKPIVSSVITLHVHAMKVPAHHSTERSVPHRLAQFPRTSRCSQALREPESASTTASKQEVNPMICLKHMAGSRKWRSAVACFVQMRSVKLQSLPPRVDVGEANVFWAAVREAAPGDAADAETYLQEIRHRARAHRRPTGWWTEIAR